MWRRSDALAFALVIVACKRGAPPPAAADAAADVEAEASAPIVDASVERTTRDVNAILEAARDEMQRMMGIEPMHPQRIKSIGHTSVVLKIEMREGQVFVFKPRSKKGHERYKGEIAAFRLGLALGIDAVPKAYQQSFGRDQIDGAIADEKTKKLIADEVVDEPSGGVVAGALMPWIDDYTVLPLEKEPLFSQWRGWLKKDATIPDDKKELAREVSTLVLFDFLTANWDRWSGGNVATSKGKMLYVDNDGAFFENPPKDALARNKRYLEGVDRFSKSVVEALRDLTEDGIRERMRAALSEKALEGLFARRKEALAVVERKELYFP